MTNRKKCSVICVFMTLILVVYKFFILFKYAINYVDVDQALMWYGTAHFAHFHFPEPMFFGQSYGTMFESLVAVPMYWINVPLNVALPLSAMFIGVFPYALLLFFINRDERRTEQLLIPQMIFLCFFSFMGFQFDILLSIPRSLTPGFMIAVIAIMLMLRTKRYLFKILSGIFMVLAYSFVASSMTIILVGILYCVLYYKQTIKQWIAVLAGILVGWLGFIFELEFYKSNPEYNLHIRLPYEYSFKMFAYNFKSFGRVMDDFTFANKGLLIFLVFIAAIIFCIIAKNIKMIFVTVVSFLGILASLGLDKLDDFEDGSILFSQSRMLLYIPVIMALLIYMYTEQRVFVTLISKLKIKARYNCIIGLAIVMIVMLIYKVPKFIEAVKDNDNVTLSHDYMLDVKSVKKVNEISDLILNKAKDNNCEIVVTYNSRTLGYAISAVKYGKLSFYNAEYDRRTWIYLEEKERLRTGNALIVFVDETGGVDFKVVKLNNESIIQWLKGNLEVQRYPSYSIFYDKTVDDKQ